MGTHSPDGSLYFQNFQPLILRAECHSLHSRSEIGTAVTQIMIESRTTRGCVVILKSMSCERVSTTSQAIGSFGEDVLTNTNRRSQP